MKLSFLPADLHLTEKDGQFVVTLRGSEIFSSFHKKKAVERFNSLKRELEEKFPRNKLSPEEIAAVLQRSIADSLVGHNSWRPEERNKKKINSTRTFG
ncbi:MAG TPA: hypothetical protein VGI46_13010 [Candidatus Acidoferrum sp.]|jgi:hypothetical protein